MKDDATLRDARLQELAQRLGVRAAERLDVERTAQAVVTRLKTEPTPEVRMWERVRPGWLRIAAALVIVVGAGVVVRNRSRTPASPPVLATAAGAELDELSAAQLRAVLEAVSAPGGEAEAASAQEVSLEDLSALELRALLAALEG